MPRSTIGSKPVEINFICSLERATIRARPSGVYVAALEQTHAFSYLVWSLEKRGGGVSNGQKWLFPC